MKLSVITGIAAVAVTWLVSVHAEAEQVFTATQSQIDNYCSAQQGGPVTWQHLQVQAEKAVEYRQLLAGGMKIDHLVREIVNDPDGLLVAHDRLRDEAALMAITLDASSDQFINMNDQQLAAYWEEEFSK